MKIAVITGASSGMGKEFVLQLEKHILVDEIWVIARRLNILESLQNEITTKIRPIQLDLTNSSSFDLYKELLEDEKPEVLLLVNAAGYGRFADFDDFPLEDDLRMIDLNVKALVAMTRLTIPYMSKGSNIIEVDSLSAFQPVPYINTYAATKSFVLSYSRGLNVEVKAKYGIRVMALCPYWVKSEFFSHAYESGSSRVQNFNYLYEAKDVVSGAYRDCYKTKKDVSIYGKYPKLQVFLVKHLSTKTVMKTWLKQQRKPKNSQKVDK